MKTNKQIEVIVFQLSHGGEALFLMLKRNAAKGGFWQPITGGIEVEESFETAARRELAEETGITEVVRLVDTGYSYTFVDDGREQREWIFGAEVPAATTPVLSAEHTECTWVPKEEALTKFLKWPGNKAGLIALCDIIGV